MPYVSRGIRWDSDHVVVQDDFTTRLALMDQVKNLPAEAVWNMACLRKRVPVAFDYLKEIKAYERDVLSN